MTYSHLGPHASLQVIDSRVIVQAKRLMDVSASIQGIARPDVR